MENFLILLVVAAIGGRMLSRLTKLIKLPAVQSLEQIGGMGLLTPDFIS